MAVFTLLSPRFCCLGSSRRTKRASGIDPFREDKTTANTDSRCVITAVWYTSVINDFHHGPGIYII